MRNYYAFATTELLVAMNEEKQKAVYDFITMLNELKTEGVGIKEPQGVERNNPYEANDTMRMIGKQNIGKYIDSEEVRGSIQDIIQANGHSFRSVISLVHDVFLYGCIIGKREVRANKKSHRQTTK